MDGADLCSECGKIISIFVFKNTKEKTFGARGQNKDKIFQTVKYNVLLGFAFLEKENTAMCYL